MLIRPWKSSSRAPGLTSAFSEAHTVTVCASPFWGQVASTGGSIDVKDSWCSGVQTTARLSQEQQREEFRTRRTIRIGGSMQRTACCMLWLGVRLDLLRF